MFFKKKYKYFLSIVAIFKNESHGIREWVDHYLSQGVDHFFLIDNGSNDDTLLKIAEYVDKGLISLVTDPTKWAQVELYNKHFLKKCKSSEWVIVCDLDEFIYARNGFSKISDYLKTRSRNTVLIRVPWKMFGSSGLIQQPQSIKHSFTKRSLYDGSISPDVNLPGFSTSKVLIKTKALKKLDIHTASIRNSYLIENANGQLTDLSEPLHQRLTEEMLESAFLHLNHYALQSKEWFLKVKCTRGAADASAHENVRNNEYYDQYDARSNDVEDNELALKSVK